MKLDDFGALVEVAKELLKQKEDCDEKAKEYRELFEKAADVIGHHLQGVILRVVSGVVETESSIDNKYVESLTGHGFSREEAIKILCARKSRPINFSRAG